MATKKDAVVTMRVKIGEAELEVTGPTGFVEEKIEKFVATHHSSAAASPAKSMASTGTQPPGHTSKKQGSLAQLFKKLSVKSDVERALIAGYFLENSQGAESF